MAFLGMRLALGGTRNPVFGHLSSSFLCSVDGLEFWFEHGCVTFRHVCTTAVKVSSDIRWLSSGWAPLHHSNRNFVRSADVC
jgi:hypothetical protein